MSGTAGRSGRPPKPIELKRKLGETRPSRVPARSQTIALVSGFGAPVPMSLGMVGRQYWGLVQEHTPWVGVVDLRLLEELCADLDAAAEMRRQIAEDGVTLTEPIVTPAGMVVGERKVAHPLLSPLRALMKEIRDLASSLGLDPTARARLGFAEVKFQSKVEELQERARARQGGSA